MVPFLINYPFCQPFRKEQKTLVIRVNNVFLKWFKLTQGFITWAHEDNAKALQQNKYQSYLVCKCSTHSDMLFFSIVVITFQGFKYFKFHRLHIIHRRQTIWSILIFYLDDGTSTFLFYFRMLIYHKYSVSISLSSRVKMRYFCPSKE